MKNIRTLGAAAGAALFVLTVWIGTADAQPAGVLASQDANAAGVVAEFTEARRKDGVLSIKIRLRNGSNRDANVEIKGSSHNYSPNYVVSGGKKYFILQDSERAPLAPAQGPDSVTIPAGSTWTWWAKYPAPPATEKAFSYYSAFAAPFDDVPIADR